VEYEIGTIDVNTEINEGGYPYMACADSGGYDALYFDPKDVVEWLRDNRPDILDEVLNK
jgi:hypothetical protein